MTFGEIFIRIFFQAACRKSSISGSLGKRCGLKKAADNIRYLNIQIRSRIRVA